MKCYWIESPAENLVMEKKGSFWAETDSEIHEYTSIDNHPARRSDNADFFKDAN